MRYIYIVVILLLTSIHVLHAGAAAPQSEQETPSVSVSPDAQTVVTDTLADLFLAASLSASLINETDVGSYEFRPREQLRDSLSRPAIHAHYPWMEPLLYPEGAPRLLAINKWRVPPNILFLFETNFGPQGDEKTVPFHLTVGGAAAWASNPKPLESGVTNTYRAVKSFITQTSHEISSASGLTIAVSENDRPMVGAINIVFVPKTSLGQHAFKLDRDFHFQTLNSWDERPYVDLRGLHGLERNIPYGLSFSPGNNNQVDGYFVANAQNEIRFAICYIWHGHEITILNALALECLVRSMGLPGNIPASVKDSVLSSWTGFSHESPTISQLSAGNLLPLDRWLISTLYQEKLPAGASVGETISIIDED